MSGMLMVSSIDKPFLRSTISPHLQAHPEENRKQTLLQGVSSTHSFFHAHYETHTDECLAASGARNRAYGLYFVEGWNVRKLWIVGGIVFVGGSLVWAILWSIFEHSLQDAFAVAAWVVAAFGVLGGAAHAVMMMG